MLVRLADRVLRQDFGLGRILKVALRNERGMSAVARARRRGQSCLSIHAENDARQMGYDGLTARDGNEAWRAIEAEDPPRLLLPDGMMPGVDGVEISRRVRAMEDRPYTYILMLTARAEPQDLIEAMDAGVDDYLTKPFNAHELRVRIRASGNSCAWP